MQVLYLQISYKDNILFSVVINVVNVVNAVIYMYINNL